MLSEYTGQKLPWGTLTGIRPTKIPMHLLEEGKRPAWNCQIICGKPILPARKRHPLAISIAVREKDILERIRLRRWLQSIRRHSFLPKHLPVLLLQLQPAESVWKDKVDDLSGRHLFKEIAYGAEAYEGRTLTTVYIGGGTPTTLDRRRSWNGCWAEIEAPLRFKPCAGVYCRSRASGQHYQGKAGSAAASSGDTDFHQSPDHESGRPWSSLADGTR